MGRLIKNFRPNPKSGAFWCLWTNGTYSKDRKGVVEFIEFHPFPTLKFRYNGDVTNKWDYSFDIEFIWLFWEVLLTRYWGGIYKYNLVVDKNKEK